MNENPVSEPKLQQTDVPDYSNKTLSELIELIQKFVASADRLERTKEAAALKQAFYKTLTREREKLAQGSEDIFAEIEKNFKDLYAGFSKEKAEMMKRVEEDREANLVKKQAIIEDLKALLEKAEDPTKTFSEFKQIQERWRSVGQVPAMAFTDLNKNYQFYVEQFYDKLNINRELRDMDFKKNLEAKTALCEAAEKLAESDKVVESFNELQKLHDEWKELGPVEKQFRDSIWERFKAATTVINKKYQAHFEQMKQRMEENLKAKTALCEQIEALVAELPQNAGGWNSVAKKIEELQAQWRKIGFATKKDNNAIYERFRASCDKFFKARRAFYDVFKAGMEENVKKKEALCEKAEQLKESTDWKATAAEFKALQEQWRGVGQVPRKLSDELWNRFRAACDEFFKRKEEDFKKSRASFQEARKSGGSERDRLVARMRSLEAEVTTKENNMLFFKGSGAGQLLGQMQSGIDAAKKEIAELKAKIKSLDKEAQQNG